MSMKALWIYFALMMVLSFAVLGWIGTRIYQEAPPIPTRVVTTEGQVLIDNGQITTGQNVWQSMGGMEVGSVWGHGSYVAPDWTADWLHREAVFILDHWANREFGAQYEELTAEPQAQLRARLTDIVRTKGVTAIPPSGGGVVEGRLFSLDTVFDEVVPFAV